MLKRMMGASLPSLLLLAFVGAAEARAPSDPTPVSCSIDGLADYSRTMPFCDLTKQSRSFGSAKSPFDKKCSVGADGWPTQDQFGLIFITETTGPGGIMMDGVYTLRFVGNATLSFPVSTATLLNYTHDPATDVSLAFVQVPKLGNGQLWIGFENTAMKGGAAGAKNISLLQPNCSLDDLEALSPQLLKLLSKFDSLRFMDWTATVLRRTDAAAAAAAALLLPVLRSRATAALHDTPQSHPVVPAFRLAEALIGYPPRHCRHVPRPVKCRPPPLLALARVQCQPTIPQQRARAVLRFWLAPGPGKTAAWMLSAGRRPAHEL